MCDRAAVHPTVRLLFKAKGVDVPGVLHHLFADRSKVPEFLEPLRAGIELGGDTKKRSVDELLIDQATILELLDVIAVTKVSTTPTPPQALALAGTAAGSGDKSQELPAGYWNDFVTDYESLVVDGRNRRFPAHLLLGAEKTLGRMVAEKKSGLFVTDYESLVVDGRNRRFPAHLLLGAEKTLGRMVAEKKSGLYTALPLGEILFSRHFTASKQVNPYSSSTKPEVTTKLFASEDGTLSKVARTIPEPQRLVTMLDAFEANKFAFIFARWGPNAEVGDYFSFWEDLTRDNPSRFAQIRMYWKKASWEMAMALRSGKTFPQAAAEVTTIQAKQDAMNRWVPPDRPTKGFEKGTEKGKKGDHKGAGKGKPSVVDAQVAQVEQWYPLVPDPCFQVRWHPDGSRPLQRAASWWLRASLRWDPTEPAQPELRSPEQGPFSHFSWAKQLTFASVFPAELNPCLAWTFQVQAALGHKLVGVRQSVIQDLQQLVFELQEDQDSALQALPAHVAAVYKQGSTAFKFQLLPLAWLLELCQFPGRNELLTELFWGFKLLGPVSRGSGWINRDDTKYSRPLPRQDFLAANRGLAGQLRVPSAPSEHSDIMLAELYKEREL
eukprot:s1760_g8.t1